MTKGNHSSVSAALGEGRAKSRENLNSLKTAVAKTIGSISVTGVKVQQALLAKCSSQCGLSCSSVMEGCSCRAGLLLPAAPVWDCLHPTESQLSNCMPCALVIFLLTPTTTSLPGKVPATVITAFLLMPLCI